MRYLWCLAGLTIVLFGAYSWYLETYTDSPIASLWRHMGGRNNKATSGSSLSPLFISTGFSLFALATLLSTPLPKGSIALLPLFIIGISGLALCVAGFICFFPFPVPRWADARYQYMKRHGMLDENGDPLPQFELSEDGEEPADNDQGWGMP